MVVKSVQKEKLVANIGTKKLLVIILKLVTRKDTLLLVLIKDIKIPFQDLNTYALYTERSMSVTIIL